jgi:hypothetical protein
MPHKNFRQGESPSTSDLQMLMDQSVITCTSTTRPSSPLVGMTIYETDTKQYRVWDGLTWAEFGNKGWTGDNLAVPGTLGVTGNTTLSGDLSVSGSFTVGGTSFTRLVDGKVHTGSVSSVTSNSTTPVNILNANATNVSIIQDRAYRVSGVISTLCSTTDTRGALELWDGTVGGTKLGGSVNFKPNGTANLYRTMSFAFLFRASSTRTIANMNLSVVHVSGPAASTAGAQADSNYFMIVEELGSASLITNL